MNNSRGQSSNDKPAYIPNTSPSIDMEDVIDDSHIPPEGRDVYRQAKRHFKRLRETEETEAEPKKKNLIIFKKRT